MITLLKACGGSASYRYLEIGGAMALRIYLIAILQCGFCAFSADAIAEGLGAIGTMDVSIRLFEDKARVVESRPNDEAGSILFADFELVLISKHGEKFVMNRVEEKWPDIPEAGSRRYAGTIQFNYPKPRPDLETMVSAVVSYKKKECVIPIALVARKDATLDNVEIGIRKGEKDVLSIFFSPHAQDEQRAVECLSNIKLRDVSVKIIGRDETKTSIATLEGDDEYPTIVSNARGTFGTANFLLDEWAKKEGKFKAELRYKGALIEVVKVQK